MKSITTTFSPDKTKAWTGVSKLFIAIYKFENYFKTSICLASTVKAS